MLETKETVTVYDKLKANFSWSATLRILDVGAYTLVFIFLARFLGVEEFGLLGLVSSIVMLVEIFSHTGINSVLVQKSGDISAYLDTAWFLQIIRGMLIFIFLYLTAPIIADAFSAPRLAAFLRFSGFICFISGFVSVGIIHFNRQIDFRKRFSVIFWPKFTFISTAIMVALYFRTIWAFFVAQLLSSIVSVAVSFLMSAFRPRLRFSVSMAKDFFSAGKWLYLTGVVGFFLSRLDIFFVNKYFSKTDAGFYFMAAALAGFLPEHFLATIEDMVCSIYAAHKDSPRSIRDIALTVIGGGSVVVGFFAGFLMIFGHDLILLALGEKWMPMEYVLYCLSVYYFFRFTGYNLGQIFLGVGRFDLLFKIPSLRLLILMVLFALVRPSDLIGVSFCLFMSVLILDPAVFYLLAIKNNLDARVIILRAYIVPVLSLFCTVTGLSIVRSFVRTSVYIDALFFIIYFFIYWRLVAFLMRKFFNDNNYLLTMRDNLKSFAFTRK